MMYDVRVTVDSLGADAGHTAVVGYVSEDDYTTCANPTTPWKWGQTQQFDTAKSRVWTLYNFVPGTVYHYKVIVGDPSGTVTRVKCGILETPIAPTPTIPEDLGYLNIQYRMAGKSDPFETRYVMFETDDCGGTSGGPITGAHYYLVAVDPSAQAIVWYLDIGALTALENASGSGFHFVPGATPEDDRILMTIDKRYLYEWSMDGRQTNYRDFAPSGECGGMAGATGPCVHHDAFRSELTGNTYVLSTGVSAVDQTGTVFEDACADSRFLDDGFQELDTNFDVVDTTHLMTDLGYDPTIDAGPAGAMLAARPTGCFSDNWEHSFDPAHGLIDWTHINSVSTSSFGGSELVDISLKEWSQIIRLDGKTGDIVWTLSADPDYSDWDVRKFPALEGASVFVGQHDVHATSENTIMFYDNRGDPDSTRVLEVELESEVGRGHDPEELGTRERHRRPARVRRRRDRAVRSGHDVGPRARDVQRPLHDRGDERCHRCVGNAAASGDRAARHGGGAVLHVGGSGRPARHPRVAQVLPDGDRRHLLS